jgi:hypothetical protein
MWMSAYCDGNLPSELTSAQAADQTLDEEAFIADYFAENCIMWMEENCEESFLTTLAVSTFMTGFDEKEFAK